jgi:DNA-binding NarL/FixJ family response regulator
VTVSALIIDDSPFARKIIRHHLTKLGFHVEGEAETAALGLRLFRELKPKLVTLDVMMPEREGIEKTRDTFLNEGATAYVIKPFSQFSFEPVRQKLQRAFPAWTA